MKRTHIHNGEIPVKEKQTQKITRTSTTVAPAKKPEPTPYEFLEPIEEKVIRMHYGLSEPDEKMLDYAVGASEDTRMRVTLMEAGNISELDGDVPVARDADPRVLNEYVKGLDL